MRVFTALDRASTRVRREEGGWLRVGWPSFITTAQMNPRDAALINDAVRFEQEGSQPNRPSRFSRVVERGSRIEYFSKISRPFDRSDFVFRSRYRDTSRFQPVITRSVKQKMIFWPGLLRKAVFVHELRSFYHESVSVSGEKKKKKEKI